MYLQDVMKIREARKPYITRKKWTQGYLHKKPEGAAIKVMLTDSPDGCLVISINDGGIHRAWRPTTEDLTADDWVTTS